ncbi:timeless protein-domain-containing protein [Mucidula mucida]|nr:timeless protein-domain-containing protein [Mucidula mucida]
MAGEHDVLDISDDNAEVIDISDGEQEGVEIDGNYKEPEEYATYRPLVKRVVDALGGGTPYRPGDSAYACLKDLKRLWRKDDDIVARLLWEARTMIKDLIPMLLVLDAEDKRAVATVDLITAMTWPVDVAAELKELDENEEDADVRPEYTHLLAAHDAYKTALCAPKVLEAIFAILLPPLAKPAKERSPRDGQVINVILHLYRNLAFVKSESSSYILRLKATHATDLLLTIAANTSHDPLFSSFNTVVLETLYLLTRFVPPAVTEATKSSLKNLLAADAELKKRPAASRHSRFGTTIQVTLKNSAASKPFVLHRGQAVDPKTSATSLWDLSKKARARPPREVPVEEMLTPSADKALRELITGFLEGAFNPFISEIIKDIRAERPKINEGDHLRLMCFSTWVLAFFLSRPERDLGLIAEITERTWVAWVLRRIREALDDKPKRLGEVKAGVGALTQLILVIEQLEDKDTFVRQLVYNGETLDISFDALKLRIDGSIRLAYELLRVLEGSDKMIRRKKGGEGEINWSFEAFESKFVTAEITAALLAHLSTTPKPMKYVLSLMHRQVVKLKAEGLYFNVSTLILFQRLLRELPKEKDLVKFIHFVLRQFFKGLETYDMLLVEAFFPRTRGDWKKFSSWEDQKKEKRQRKEKIAVEKELHVKDGYSWKEQMGIALKALQGKDSELAEWVKELLTQAVAWLKMDKGGFVVPITSDERGKAVTKDAHLKLVLRLCGFKIDEEGVDGELQWSFPEGSDAERYLSVVTEFLETPIEINEELVSKTTRRRRKVASSSSSSDSDGEANYEEVSDGEGGKTRKKKIKTKKSRRKRDDAEATEKRKRKEKEKEQYKSAQFIEDSDEEYGDMESFLKQEEERRLNRTKPANMYAERPEGMRSHGTKKRKKKAEDDGAKRKKRKSTAAESDADVDVEMAADSDADDDNEEHVEAPPKPRPRPKPVLKAAKTSPIQEEDEEVVHPRKAKRLLLTDDEEE